MCLFFYGFEAAVVLAALVADAGCGKYAVERGHEQQGEYGGESETADYGCTHRTPHFSALAGAYGHGHHAEDGGEGGHHNRTKARLATVYYGLAHGHAAFAVEGDVVDKHDTVLYYDTDKHDGANHRHHVERVAGEPKDDEHAGECEEKRCHDNAGVGVAFELCGHDYVDENNDEHGEHEQVGERILLVLIATGYLNCDALGNIHLFDGGVRFRYHVAHRYALYNGRHGDDAFAVFSLDCRRGETLYHSADIADAHGLAG